MKMKCNCGESIQDYTDYQVGKAYLVSDQDKEDLLAASKNIFSAFSKLSRKLYQCSNCGRIIILEKNGDVSSFLPENVNNTKKLFQSIEGENWKRPLVGRWYANKGVLSWEGTIDQGYLADFKTAKLLEDEYFKVFKRLHEKQILRTSFLSIDGVTVHSWKDGE